VTLTASVAAVRRMPLPATAFVPAPTACRLVTGHPAAAAVIATAGAAVLAALLATSHHRLARAARRVHHLQTEVARLHTEVAAAHIDPVTGLASRAVAEQHLRDAAGTDVTVALIDVDDMHGINAAHHHDGGDRYLAAVAERLTHAAEPGDLVARLGGDEFAIITGRDPHTLACALAAATAAPVAIHDTTLPMNVSVGICRVPGGDPHAALGRADRAMFTAKRRRSGIAHYDPARDGVPLPAGVRPRVRHRDRRPDRRIPGIT
jgi:diguanylate cyclase (GGDEF)-like protein